MSVTVLLLAACGTRVSDARLTAAGSLGSAALVQAGTDGDQSQGSTGGATGTGHTTGVQAVTPTATQAATTGGVAPSGSTSAGGTTSGGSAGGSTSTGGTSSGGGTAANATGACTSQLAPVSLGQNGAFSGFLQETLGGYRPGLAAWAGEVNARGGLQCHPVRLIQKDDGSDPARTTSNVKDLIENQHVVAMVGADVPITIAAYRNAVGPAGIPTIGGDAITPDWNTDPLMYPPGVTSLTGFAGAIKALVLGTGKKKLGLIYCVEASICGLIHQQIKSMAAKAGATVVSQQSASLTQTDFTSQCQNLKNDGAEVMFLTVDSSASQRFFRSCASIGYRPPSATTGIAISPTSAADANVRAASVYLSSPTPGYFQTSVPAVAAFRAAMQRYAPGAPIDQPAMGGYAAGKLLEAGLAKVAAKARSGPITTAMIIQGMNSLKNETLGGLTSVPLTFSPGPHPTGSCYFTTLIDSRGVTDQNKGRATCL